MSHFTLPAPSPFSLLLSSFPSLSLFLLLCIQLPEQWDPHGSPQTSLSAPVLPTGMPFPTQPQHSTSVPDSTEGFDLNKPDPYDLYEKSRAIYESRREYWYMV